MNAGNTKLDVIDEDLFSFDYDLDDNKLANNLNDLSGLKNKKEINLPFKDCVKLDVFKKPFSEDNQLNLVSTTDSDLRYLSKYDIVVDSKLNSGDTNNTRNKQKQKQNTTLSHKQKYDKIKTKIYDNRNENMEKLLKDVRIESNLNFLKDNLKNEFDLFLNKSADNSVQSLKKITDSNEVVSDRLQDHIIRMKSRNKNNESNNKTNNWAFITEQQEESQITPLSRPSTSNKRTPIADPFPLTPNTSITNINKLKAQTSSSCIDNMQVALIEHQDSNKEKQSIININKTLQNIKRIDLPHFQTELHQVCQYGNDSRLLKFCSEDIEHDLVKKQNGLGRYLIHECCVKGNVSMLKSILPHIDDLNKLDNEGQNAAHIASKYGEIECIKILFANGINLEQKDNSGMQPIHVASKFNHANIINFLFEIGISFDTPSFNEEKKLPIHYAAEFGSFDALKVLCKFSVDVSVGDCHGNSAGHYAAKNDHLDCLKYLIKVGFPPDKVRNKYGRNIAHTCCLYGGIKCLHWLLENNINKELLDDFGNSLSHLCCLGGQAECLNCCIQHDVEINQLNKKGETPIEMARKAGKSLHVEKAVKNQITCNECVKNALKLKWEKEHERTVGEKTIEKNKKKIYDLKCTSTSDDDETKLVNKQKKQENLNQTEINQLLNFKSGLKRDFVAQYFGPDIV